MTPLLFLGECDKFKNRKQLCEVEYLYLVTVLKNYFWEFICTIKNRILLA